VTRKETWRNTKKVGVNKGVIIKEGTEEPEELDEAASENADTYDLSIDSAKVNDSEEYYIIKRRPKNKSTKKKKQNQSFKCDVCSKRHLLKAHEKRKIHKLLASTKLNYTRAMEKLSTKSTWRRYDITKDPEAGGLPPLKIFVVNLMFGFGSTNTRFHLYHHCN